MSNVTKEESMDNNNTIYFLDVYGRELSIDLDTSVSDKNQQSYEGVDFITLDKRDAEALRRYYEDLKNELGNDQVSAQIGGNITLAIERIIDRLDGRIY